MSFDIARPMVIRESILIFSSLVLGFLEAIPVGATQLEIARRSLNGFLASAAALVAGSVLSDAMYGAVALWGVAPFLQDPGVAPYFWLVGALATGVVGVWAIREGQPRRISTQRSVALLKSGRIAFVTGFSLAITNPFMIAYWLIGVHMLNNVGLIDSSNALDLVLVLVAGSLGIGSYLLALAAGVYKAKHFFSDRAIRRITTVFGILLLVIASYFTTRGAILLIRGPEGTLDIGGTLPGGS